jgi:hypothetical protein
MCKKVLTMILFLSLALAACAGDEAVEEDTPGPPATETPPAPAPLPTAVPPDSAEIGNWAVTFRYDFPDAFWVPGDHTYGFVISCPGQALDFNSEWIFFRVSESTLPQPFPIYLRLYGLSQEPFTPAYLDEGRINPAQATAAVVHLVGLTGEQVEEAQEECEVLLAWDQNPPQALEVSDVFEQ